MELCIGAIVEQIIRPTGLLDPEVDVRETRGQIDDLVGEIRSRADKNERVLITTLTKKMSEDLTDYLSGLNIRVKYLHSDIGTIERVQILRELRIGEFDALVGINLLREGLDLPEVSLVAILDADKEGFLRSKSSLLQTAGRAARNVEGLVILYADKITDAMKNLIEITRERRKLQNKYNLKNGITPKTVFKSVDEILTSTSVADSNNILVEGDAINYDLKEIPIQDKKTILAELKKSMIKSSKNLDYEKAAQLRDEIKRFESDLSAIAK
jgi:excinuclease ABC subunit B